MIFCVRLQINEIGVIGSTYHNWGNLEKAQYYLKIGYQLNLEYRDYFGAAYCSMILGLIDETQKNYNSALERLNTSLDIINTQDANMELFMLYMTEKAGILIKMNQYEEAYQLLQAATCMKDSLAIPTSTLSSPLGMIEIEYNLYAYYKAIGKPHLAEQQLLRAYQEAIELKIVGALQKYRQELSKFYTEIGRPDKANTFARSYLLLNDSLQQVKNQYNVSKYEIEQKDLDNYKELQRQKSLRNGFIIGFIVMLAFGFVFFIQHKKIVKEKKRSENLLLNILPAEIAEELKSKGKSDAKQFDEVTVMFTDFKGFTKISEKLSPSELVNEIDFCFKAFDEIVTKYNIEKIKTIGDAYMCVGGLPAINQTHAQDVINAAIEIQQFMLTHLTQRNLDGKIPFEIRIGVHTGTVVAGVVGLKKFAYDIWGDTVNIASRMESAGEAGKINISHSTYQHIKDKFICTHRGKIQAKNKGEIDMYFVEERIS